ncbi:MAG TPA: ATP-binding protein [Thermoanaerobaculia bacterium]|nr:ATP-binding protein [Thermoanaerobaculia bacterium]
MTTVTRYALAVIATAVAAILTVALPELLAPMRLFFFWCAVLIAAIVAGPRPAALAIVLAVVAQFFIGQLSTPVDFLRLALFILFSGGISVGVAFRRRAEDRAEELAAAVRLSELRHRTLVEAAPARQAVWTATPDGRIDWSDAWSAITGLSRAQLEGGGGMSVVHADDAARTWERWKAAIAAGTLYDDEIRVRVKDGTWRWFATRATPVVVDGRVVEWVGMIADIDERRRHQQQSEFLSSASELLASSLDYQKTLRTLARLCVPALGDWCSIHLGTGADFTRVAVEHVDPAKVHFVEQLDRRLRPAPEHDPVVQAMLTGRSHLVAYASDELLAALLPSEDQRSAMTTLGLRSWIVAPMIAGGRTLGTLTVVHGESGRRYSEADVPFFEDLARRAATAIENARLYEEAEGANRAKDEFLATLSHELRTPLTAITGWAHMLQTGATDEVTGKLAVDTIVRSARTQAELIDDLLDLSRVVAGTLHLSVATVDLRPIVEDVLVAARPAADAKTLTLQFDDETPAALVRGDERRLRQVVWNLVTNAVKFTETGGSIRIALTLHERNARLEVTDTGRGIEASFLPHVWDRFRQADSSTSRQHGGLGLGLSVVRHLVELHGGTVTAESAGAGQGARFAVEIPLARLDAAAPGAARAESKREMPLRGRKILVVDDDADARVVLTAMLRQHGAEVASADSVTGALRAMEGQRFAAIVSDIAMPGEDGYALARQVRAESQVPMIAVSAIATGADDRVRALGAGYDEFVRKPVDPRQLAEIVRQAILNRNQEM